MIIRTRRIPLPFVALTLLALVGCPTGEDAVCPPADDLASGEVTASLDGAAWSAADGYWFWSGTSLQVVTGSHGGWRLSMLGRTTADGTTVRDAVGDDAFPVEVPLATGLDGGWLLLYPDEGDSFASEKAAGGSWFITAVDGDELMGCFAAEISDDDRTIAVEDGLLRIPQTAM